MSGPSSIVSWAATSVAHRELRQAGLVALAAEGAPIRLVGEHDRELALADDGEATGLAGADDQRLAQELGLLCERLGRAQVVDDQARALGWLRVPTGHRATGDGGGQQCPATQHDGRLSPIG